MTHQERQNKIRRHFALETRLTAMTNEQLREATAERMAASFGLTEPETKNLLDREKSKRRI